MPRTWKLGFARVYGLNQAFLMHAEQRYLDKNIS